MVWEARFVGKCGCGACGNQWNVFKDDGTQISKQSEEHAKLIAAAQDLRDVVRALVMAQQQGCDPELMVAEDSPLMDAARDALLKTACV